jgi:hypothetical protein
MLCESYLDTGNRAAFSNGGAAVQIHPDFPWRAWDRNGCAPLLLRGPRQIALRRHLLTQAASLGFATTGDPGLTVLVDGREVRTDTDGRRWRICLPDAAENVRLISRVWVPAHMRPDEEDSRLLGVAISHVWLNGREVSLDSPGLASGWHTPEAGFRWTDGGAKLLLSGPSELAFEVVMTGTYWIHNDAPRAVRAA